MTVAELISELQKLNSATPVTVYESEPDDYITVQSIEMITNSEGPQVRIYSGWEPA